MAQSKIQNSFEKLNKLALYNNPAWECYTKILADLVVGRLLIDLHCPME